MPLATSGNQATNFTVLSLTRDGSVQPLCAKVTNRSSARSGSDRPYLSTIFVAQLHGRGCKRLTYQRPEVKSTTRIVDKHTAETEG